MKKKKVADPTVGKTSVAHVRPRPPPLYPLDTPLGGGGGGEEFGLQEISEYIRY